MFVGQVDVLAFARWVGLGMGFVTWIGRLQLTSFGGQGWQLLMHGSDNRIRTVGSGIGS